MRCVPLQVPPGVGVGDGPTVGVIVGEGVTVIVSVAVMVGVLPTVGVPVGGRSLAAFKP